MYEIGKCFESLTITIAGEDMGKFWHAAGEYVNWGTHFGEQFGDAKRS